MKTSIAVVFILLASATANARDYDPEVGRFLEEDPIPFASSNQFAYAASVGSVSQYQYAYNNPMRYTDPLGLQPCENPNPSPGPGQGLGPTFPIPGLPGWTATVFSLEKQVGPTLGVPLTSTLGPFEYPTMYGAAGLVMFGAYQGGVFGYGFGTRNDWWAWPFPIGWARDKGPMIPATILPPTIYNKRS